MGQYYWKKCVRCRNSEEIPKHTIDDCQNVTNILKKKL